MIEQPIKMSKFSFICFMNYNTNGINKLILYSMFYSSIIISNIIYLCC